jgi:autotransporter family porin
MPEGSVAKGLSFTAQHQVAVLGALGATVLMVIVAVGLNPIVALVPFALLGAWLLWRAVRYSTAHPLWLACPLILVELLTATWFLSGSARAVFHYGLVALFCLPLLPAAWRSRSFAHDGFGLYTCYFLWAVVTVTYSLEPAYSASRLLCALMVFGAMTFAITEVNQPEDVNHVLIALLLAYGVIVSMVAFSAVALPRSFAWIVPTDENAESAGNVIRFCGVFNGPNDVGELMLATVGCSAVLWQRVHGKWRWLLGALVLMAVGAAGLADSRTPFVALAIGGGCYLVWRYRRRAVMVLLLLGVLAAAVSFKIGGDEYLSRGNVTTLTGRTDVWEFALSQIAERPVLGYGYAVAGTILQSRYFPIWWGPWDEGPHSSLHDGYIDRAVGVGVIALLVWLFIVLRPWYDVLRRPEDRWGLKPVAFWMVIPMLVHNLAEVSISDCTGMVGMSFFLIWAIAERARVLGRAADLADRREHHAAIPAAAAALTGSILAALVCMVLPGQAYAQNNYPANYHFPTLPPHAALPGGAVCAVAASNGNSWEPRSGNYAANHRVLTFVELVSFHLAPIKGSFAPISDFMRVDGKFTGTTDQILRWGACKWGIDEDVVRAEAVAESHWRQEDSGDQSYDNSKCPPGIGFAGAWDGASCQQSYGIMQVKFTSFGGWPLPKDSTAFNVDFRLAYQRACMNGDISYLGQRVPSDDNPRYPQGSTDQMLWGCMGDWYSGSWYDAGAVRYIAEVKQALADRTWTKIGF